MVFPKLHIRGQQGDKKCKKQQKVPKQHFRPVHVSEATFMNWLCQYAQAGSCKLPQSDLKKNSDCLCRCLVFPNKSTVHQIYCSQRKVSLISVFWTSRECAGYGKKHLSYNISRMQNTNLDFQNLNVILVKFIAPKFKLRSKCLRQKENF